VNPRIKILQALSFAVWNLLTISIASASSFQLISTPAPTQAANAGGANHSFAPVLSPDGRFVLFASTANNLCLTRSNTIIPSLHAERLNVFLRDQSNTTTILISERTNGLAGGNGDSMPLGISADGHFALFESSASDLVANDTNNAFDIFVRDNLAGTISLVSVSTNGFCGNGASRGGMITPDGRFVAFVSTANNLVPADTNGIADVFLRDLQASSTTLISVGARATNSGVSQCASESPEVTPDGRSVVFFSTATNLVAGVTTAGEIYSRDVAGGITTMVSTNARANLAAVQGLSNSVSYNYSVSTDGVYVVYEASPAPTTATSISGIILRQNLATGVADLIHTNAAVLNAPWEEIRSISITPDGQRVAFIANTNGTTGTTTCVQLWDAANGVCTVVSAGLDGTIDPNSVCDSPVISVSGQYVSFVSSATNLTTNVLAGEYHTYLRNVAAQTTQLVDADSAGMGYGTFPGSVPWLGGDGAIVLFEAPTGPGVTWQLWARHANDATNELLSAHGPSLASASADGISRARRFSTSADGRYVAIESGADNLVSGDTDQVRDIFVRDLRFGTNQQVTVGANGPSTEAVISPDGRFVAFTSVADNLSPADSNRLSDVFLKDLRTGTLTTISVATNGISTGNSNSSLPIISSGGRFVLFQSRATNLAPGPPAGFLENLFLRDTTLGATYALGSFLDAAMTTDGRYIAYSSGGGLVLSLWDTQVEARIYTNSIQVSANPTISEDGKRIAFVSGAQIVVNDRGNNTNIQAGSASALSPRVAPHLSRDGRFLVYASSSPQALVDTNGAFDVYHFDVDNRVKTLVSRAFDFAGAANAASDSPDISPDGRFVLYRSFASNIVPGQANGWYDIFLYDVVLGKNTRLTTSLATAPSSDKFSLAPFFSGDGRHIVFTSWDSDLIGNDFNQDADVFSYGLLYASIGISNNFPVISWPANPGENYSVLFSPDIASPIWNPLPDIPVTRGNEASIQDTNNSAPTRFYRVLKY
jgi:Tol biopolymer transport system component